ncbi:MAG: ral nucleoside transport system permease protein [Thermoleophilaceae bacterium]|nr:ral nucleoside transport system permease protein [Thermoleophilaceae bacterium]
METIVQSASIAGVPLLLGALAVLVASRAGVLNLAVEGLMLVGAFVGAAVAAAALGDGLAFAAALAAGGIVGLGLGWVMVVARADQVVVGVAFNILMLGLTGYAFGVITSDSRDALNPGQPVRASIPGLSEIPGIGPLFDMHWIAYVAFVLVPIISFVLFRTGLGARLRACGEYAEGARAVGIDVIRTRLYAMVVSGMLSSAAGAFLVLGDIGLFRRNLTGGRGYIAFVIVILARYHPVGALLAAAAFGLAQALTFYLQLQGIDIPSQFILATPYVVTLLAIILLGRRIGQPPAEEGRPLRTTA